MEGVCEYRLITGGLLNEVPAPTPLPATLPLFAGGLGFVGYLTGRKKRKADQALAPRKPFKQSELGRTASWPFLFWETREQCSDAENDGAGKDAKDEKGDYFLAVHVWIITEWSASSSPVRAVG